MKKVIGIVLVLSILCGCSANKPAVDVFDRLVASFEAGAADAEKLYGASVLDLEAGWARERMQTAKTEVRKMADEEGRVGAEDLILLLEQMETARGRHAEQGAKARAAWSREVEPNFDAASRLARAFRGYLTAGLSEEQREELRATVVDLLDRLEGRFTEEEE